LIQLYFIAFPLYKVLKATDRLYNFKSKATDRLYNFPENLKRHCRDSGRMNGPQPHGRPGRMLATSRVLKIALLRLISRVFDVSLCLVIVLYTRNIPSKEERSGVYQLMKLLKQ
jgi:hypothetical protein